jgi:hypothetical protein
MPIRYITTDLDIQASFDFTPLAEALKTLHVRAHINPMCYDMKWQANFNADWQFEEPNTTIAAMLNALDRLDHDSLLAWSKCERREFNIGYDCGNEPWAYNDGLSNETLARLAKSGATLRITIYPERPES